MEAEIYTKAVSNDNNNVNNGVVENNGKFFIDNKILKILKITGMVFAGLVALLVAIKIVQMVIVKVKNTNILLKPIPPTGVIQATPSVEVIAAPTRIQTATQRDLDLINNDVAELRKEDSRFVPPNLIFDLKLQP